MFLFLISCDKDDPVPASEDSFIANISLDTSSSIQQGQEIKVTIQKATPCHVISEIKKTISGKIYDYNFIIHGQDNPCITVVSKEEVVISDFDPSSVGQYTLNFSINGELFETMTVVVTE